MFHPQVPKRSSHAVEISAVSSSAAATPARSSANAATATQTMVKLLGGITIGCSVFYVAYRLFRWSKDRENGDDELFTSTASRQTNNNTWTASDVNANNSVNATTVVPPAVDNAKRLAAIHDIKNLVPALGGKLRDEDAGNRDETNNSDDSYETDLDLEFGIANEMESILRGQIIELSAELENNQDEGGAKRKKASKKKGRQLSVTEKKLKFLETAKEYLETMDARQKLVERIKDRDAAMSHRKDIRSLQQRANAAIYRGADDDNIDAAPHQGGGFGSAGGRHTRGGYGDYDDDDDEDDNGQQPWNDEEEWEDDDDDDENWGAEENVDEEYPYDEEDDEDEAEYEQWLIANGIDPERAAYMNDDDIEDMMRRTFEDELLQHVADLKLQHAAASGEQPASGTVNVTDEGSEWSTEDEGIPKPSKAGGKGKRIASSKRKSRQSRRAANANEPGAWVDL